VIYVNHIFPPMWGFRIWDCTKILEKYSLLHLQDMYKQRCSGNRHAQEICKAKMQNARYVQVCHSTIHLFVGISSNYHCVCNSSRTFKN